MKSLLVTGGAGFIGSNFARHWRRSFPGDRILVLDLLTYAGNLANLAGVPDIRFVRGDIADAALVRGLIDEHAVDTIVNFAAETHVDRSISSPRGFLHSNIIGTHTLLECAREAWDGAPEGTCRFHQVSTDEVFGSLGLDDPAFHEGTPFAPNSPYSASKASADHLVRAYHQTYGLPATVSHCSNNYGPYQFPEKLIPLFVINALEGRPLPIYGDGLNVRDWLFVDDHCRAIELILTGGRVGESYCIGGGCALPNMTIVDTLCTAVDALFAHDPGLAARHPHAPAAQGRPTASLKRFVTDRLGHDRRYEIDDARIRRELGYAPVHDFRCDFAATVRWFVENPEWWQAIGGDASAPSLHVAMG
jgi:dTDP-glucose 4,6-dehydratase